MYIVHSSIHFLHSEPCGNINLWQSRKNSCLFEPDKHREGLKQARQLPLEDESCLCIVRDLLEEALVHLLVIRLPSRLSPTLQHVVFADLPVKRVFRFIFRRREVIYRL